jgi:hypothetical protein
MTTTYTLALVAAWFVFGMARIVTTSRLAEYRIDHPAPGTAMAIDRAARAKRLDAANYDPRGRRLLPWYRAINTTYWVLAAGAFSWAVLHG